MKSDFAKKFLSRKFLVSLIGMIVGLAIALGADSSEIMQIAGAVTSAVSAVSYIFGEAKIDAAAVDTTITIQKDEDPEEAEEPEGNDWK